jgi:hypothetical protein
MIIFYDLRRAEQSQIRFSDAQFWKNLARLSRQPAINGTISPKATRLTLPRECIPRVLTGMPRQMEFVIICGLRRGGDDRSDEVRTDV